MYREIREILLKPRRTFLFLHSFTWLVLFAWFGSVLLIDRYFINSFLFNYSLRIPTNDPVRNDDWDFTQPLAMITFFIVGCLGIFLATVSEKRIRKSGKYLERDKGVRSVFKSYVVGQGEKNS